MRGRESFAGAKMVSPVCLTRMACRTLHFHFGTEKSEFIRSKLRPRDSKTLTARISDFLKERLFGLSNPQGNHGESIKECHFHLDNTPTVG